MSFEPLKPKEYRYVDATPKREIDWRGTSMILADNVQKLSDMVKRAYSDNSDIVEPLKEVDEYCAQIIAAGAIQGAKR